MNEWDPDDECCPYCGDDHVDSIDLDPGTVIREFWVCNSCDKQWYAIYEYRCIEEV